MVAIFPFPSSPLPYAGLIAACTISRALKSGRSLHARLIIAGVAKSPHFAPKLIAFYAVCKHLQHARRVFDEIPKPRSHPIWAALIGSYARHGFYHEAMASFSEMRKEDKFNDRILMPNILKVCGHLHYRKTGEGLHAVVQKNGFGWDPFVSCALIDMYSRCENVDKAKRVFDEMSEMDLVSSNTMVSCYVRNGFLHEALHLVEKMRLSELKPDIFTWNSLICGFSQANDDLTVKKILENMKLDGIQPDTISFTSIISGYIQNFRTKKAYVIFRKMMQAGSTPTPPTITSLVPGPANTMDLRRGREIHGYSISSGLNDDVYVKSALIDMYAKCGSLSEALAIFQHMLEKNTTTWNSMIFGYANHGRSNHAIELFNRMVKEDREKLDHLSFTAALTACVHSGNIELGEKLFRGMRDEYGIVPRVEHYACMVDLLGRVGRVDEAYWLVWGMPMEPDLFVWGSLMGACRRHGRVDLAEVAARKLGELEPGSSGSDVALLGLYADSSRWRSVMTVKMMMRKKKLKGFPGRSWIEVSES